MHKTDIPAIRIAVIDYLTHVAEPADKELVKSLIIPYANDPNPSIQESVKAAMVKLDANAVA